MFLTITDDSVGGMPLDMLHLVLLTKPIQHRTHSIRKAYSVTKFLKGSSLWISCKMSPWDIV